MKITDIKQVSEGKPPKQVLDELGLDRYCCRSVFLGQEDLIELVSRYKKS